MSFVNKEGASCAPEEPQLVSCPRVGSAQPRMEPTTELKNEQTEEGDDLTRKLHEVGEIGKGFQ